MLPPDGTMRAAMRWLDLLSRSSFEQATAIINAEPLYADLTQTQYAAAIEWLKGSSLLTATESGLHFSNSAAWSASTDIGSMLFSAAVETSQPAWLSAADDLIADAGDLPADVSRLARTVGISPGQAAIAVRQIHRKLDLEERSSVGIAGERALVEMLERYSPGSVTHVAMHSDGLGYDLEFRHKSVSWHLEVKSTTRRGRLAVYLSRHEHDIASLDPDWRLVAVGLDSKNQIRALATAHTYNLLSRAPKDQISTARWESVRYLIQREDLTPGMPFCGLYFDATSQGAPGLPPAPQFDWMPNSPDLLI